MFINLSKDFDTVDHNILINTIYHYGIRGNVLDRFTNYLCNRKQYVSINNVNSNLLPVARGVPQGSILDALLFIFFVNGTTGTSELAEMLMFADDTNSFFKHANNNNNNASVCILRRLHPDDNERVITTL